MTALKCFYASGRKHKTCKLLAVRKEKNERNLQGKQNELTAACGTSADSEYAQCVCCQLFAAAALLLVLSMFLFFNVSEIK